MCRDKSRSDRHITSHLLSSVFHSEAQGRMSQHNWTAGLTSFAWMQMSLYWWPTLNPLS